VYLERPRLLRRLPDSAGYIVWLEAPYGYGKSVLAAQWAAQLESDGWRVVWLATLGEDPRSLLARALGLPQDAPWGAVIERVWAQPTLVILEDLEGGERFSALVRNLGGLLLIASRRALNEPEIPRAMSEGRLIHLVAADLAFTLEEAGALFGDPERARGAWKHSNGWSLPLHLSALTGEVPERAALIEGMRESLAAEVWDEALLLSSLTLLPQTQATSHTRVLADAGFAQALETGYRLHPLAAETVLELFLDDVRRVIEREAARLPPTLRGEALERVGATAELGRLLETEPDLAALHPGAVLRWDASATASRGVHRLIQVGDALCALGRRSDGVQRLLEAARTGDASPDQALAAYRDAIWYLCDDNVPQARSVAQEAGGLLDQVGPEDASRFLNNLSRIHLQASEFDQAEAVVTRALALLPVGHPRRFALQINLATMRWYSRGDLDGHIAVKEGLLPEGAAYFPDHVGPLQADLGRLKALLGHTSEAIHRFQQAARHTRTRPWVALEAEAWALLLQRQLDALPEVLGRLARWENAESEDRVRGFWAIKLTESGQPAAALERLGDSAGLVCSLARALALARLGRVKEALRALPERPKPTDGREPALHWQAIHYRISLQDSSLAALMGLSLVGERILPGLVPVAELPRDRPDLARPYPLRDVLASGWKEAIIPRLPELPPLELRVLGGFQVRRLGEELGVVGRLREILLLLLLGESREAIGEVLWPELERDRVRNNLHVNLNQMRKLLEPWGVTSYLEETRLARANSDLGDLEAALERGDASSVMRLYRGKLAPGVDLPPVNDRRDQLHERVVDMLFQASLMDPTQMEAYLERVLELEPLHEPALKHLLAHLVTVGRRKTAERRYQDFAQRLRDEMGLEPMPETRRALR
jgi:DNA-binding SARP family transcriptional activator